MRILGIDPGGTTGVVNCVLHDDEPLNMVEWAEFKDMEEVGDYVFEWDKADDGTGVVVCEDFVDRNNSFVANAGPAHRTIGMVQWLAYTQGFRMELPLPQARHAVQDKTLKTSGYWIVGGKGHARQALKHLLARCVLQGHGPTIKALFPRR